MGSSVSQFVREWSNEMTFVDYEENAATVETFPPEIAVSHARLLDYKKQIIKKAGLWTTHTSVGTKASYWFIYMQSSEYFYTFEKRPEGIFVQRSKDEDDVLEKFCGLERKEALIEDQKLKTNPKFNDNMLHVIQWIVDSGEVDETFDAIDRNSTHFSSKLYKAIVREDRCSLIL